MTWGTVVDATQLTSITTIQYFNVTPSLGERELAHIQVVVDFPSTPTDHAILEVFSTLDDSSYVWDTTPLFAFRLANSPDPGIISFFVKGVYRFRIGVRRSGTTDTLTTADLSYNILAE